MIEAKGLTRRFGTQTVVKDVRFTIPKGQVLGFLGPNGAGKTTTMKMLTGYLEPSAGTAEIGGYDIRTHPIEVKRLLGYLPESAPLYGEMTVEEYLDFVAKLRELGNRKSALDKMSELCQLETVWYRPIENLSKGFRQRVGLAAALIHDPEILILDEPTDGLDPNQKFQVRKLVKELGRDKTIILSTHILEEVEAMCERVIIIADGQVVADDPPSVLKRRSGYFNAVSLQVSEALEVSQVVNILSSIPHVERVVPEGKGSYLVLPKNQVTILDEVAAAASRQSWAIKQIHMDTGRLDDVFRAVTLA